MVTGADVTAVLAAVVCVEIVGLSVVVAAPIHLLNVIYCSPCMRTYTKLE